MNSDSYDLSKYRLEKAKEDFATAVANLADGYYSGSINRSYYSIFHAMRAVLSLDGFDSKKHSGIIAFFRQNYIKTEIFEREFSEIIGKAFEIRNKNDYDDFIVVSADEAKQQIADAELFIAAIEVYLHDKWRKMK